MSKPLLIGVDPHRKKNVVQMMADDGRELGRAFAVDNNRPGTLSLIERIVEQVERGGHDQIKLITEATGWYWFHLFQTLSQDACLNRWPVALYPINPRLTARFKGTYSDLDKDDATDAYVLADRLRFGRDLPAPFRPDDIYGPLRLLTRYRYHVVHNLAREKAYCLAILYLKASEYTRLEPFSHVFGAASRAVIEGFPSIQAVADIPLTDLIEFIDVKGKRRFPDPTENARRLRQVAQDSYQLPDAWLQPVNTILHLSFQHIAMLEAQQDRLDTAIAQHMVAIPQTLDTIPGFGPVLSAGIIAEIAGVERFNGDDAKVANYAGLRWRHSASADFQAEHTPLTRTGNAYLRYYLCEAANIVRMHDAEYKAFYQGKYHEVPKHRHKRAIVLTARKLVRLVVRLLTTNQPYQPRRL